MPKKQKLSYYKKAKKLGKKGLYGQGYQLSTEEYNFFMQVYKHLNDPEFKEKDLIANNFLRSFETKEKVRELVSNQIVSRILDDVLPYAPQQKLIFLITCVCHDIRIYCTDPFASHVLQSLVGISIKYYQENAVLGKMKHEEDAEDEPITKESRAEFEAFLVKISKYVRNNLEEFISNSYATHIIRSIIEVCSGKKIAFNLKSSHKSQTNHSSEANSTQILKVPDELKTIFDSIIMSFTNFTNLVDVISNESSSAVLQSTLLAASYLGKDEMASRLIKHIRCQGLDHLRQNSSYSNLHPLFTMNATIRLFEEMFASANPSEQKDLFSTYCEAHVGDLIDNNMANYAIQKVLSTWKDEDTFIGILELVQNHLEKALNLGYTGILYAVIQTLRRFTQHQYRCLQLLTDLLQCGNSEIQQLKLVACALFMTPLSTYEKKKESLEPLPVSLHGALIVQELLHINKPIKIIRSFCSFSIDDLVKIACDPRGSHIFDAFNKAPFVGEKSRETLASKFKGSYINLACNKHGSRSLDAIWNGANIKTKSAICSELAQNLDRLDSNSFGKYFISKFQLTLFNRRSKSDWHELVSKEQKKKDLLKNFLGDDDDDNKDEPPKKKKKKNK